MPRRAPSAYERAARRPDWALLVPAPAAALAAALERAALLWEDVFVYGADGHSVAVCFCPGSWNQEAQDLLLALSAAAEGRHWWITLCRHAGEVATFCEGGAANPALEAAAARGEEALLEPIPGAVEGRAGLLALLAGAGFGPEVFERPWTTREELLIWSYALASADEAAALADRRARGAWLVERLRRLEVLLPPFAAASSIAVSGAPGVALTVAGARAPALEAYLQETEGVWSVAVELSLSVEAGAVKGYAPLAGRLEIFALPGERSPIQGDFGTSPDKFKQALVDPGVFLGGPPSL